MIYPTMPPSSRGRGAESEVLPQGRLRADRERYERLKRAGFAGRDMDLLGQELWAYGWLTLRAWMKDGSIIKQCAEKGIVVPAFDSEKETMMRVVDVRDELAYRAVELAVKDFTQKFLPQGSWDPAKGASMRTYFVYGCLYHFRDAFKSWARSHRRLLAEVSSTLFQTDAETRDAGAEDLVSMRDTLRRIMSVAKWEEQAICALIYERGWTQAEIGRELSMSSRAVERHMRNLRGRAKWLVSTGRIEPRRPRKKEVADGGVLR